MFRKLIPFLLPILLLTSGVGCVRTIYVPHGTPVRLRRVQKRIKAFGQSIRNLGLKMAGLGTAILAPLLGAAKAFSSMGDQVAKMAKRTGLSVEALSELRFVASQTGTEFESLEMGFRRMQRSIYDAGRGLSTAKDALTDLGLRFEDLDGLSPEEQFKLLGEAISRIEDPTKKAAIAMTLFGRTGTNLLPMFAKGAAGIEQLQKEARRLGLTMSSKDAEAAEDFTDALAAYQGIADAMAAGDISLAVKVLWLSIKMEWTRGVNFLEKAWLNFRNFFIRIGYNAWHGLLAVVEVVWNALEVGWIETTAFFSKTWASFTGFFAKTWERIKAGAQKAWNWIKSLFDDSIDLAAENKLVEQQKQAAISQIDNEQQRKIAEREAQRQAERQRAAAVHEATMAEIGRENLRKHSELDAEYERRMAENESDLEKARKEWRDAIEEARKKRQAKEKAGAGPGKLDSADDIIAKANRALAGMGDLLAGQAAKIGSQGTFVAANVLGLQAGGITDRMANGIDKIERNTRPLRNAQELSFT